MKKNVISQVIGAQMVDASDGSAFTGAVTAYRTIDGGTQATGDIASGACTPEGNGFYSYVTSAADTDGDHIAWTFTGSGAVPVTLQVYTNFPQTVDNDVILQTTSTHSAADVWAEATRTLSAGTNLNDISTTDLDTALSTIGLDHLVSQPVIGTDVVDNSIFAQLVSKSATANWDDFDNETDSLQAIRDEGANWVTAVGFATASDVTTAISGLNDVSTTDLDTALSGIHLDHLFAVAYDPASKPGLADALLNELIGDDAGVSQFTANALELAPSGGASADAIADAVWTEAIADHSGASGSTAEALNAAGGAGDPWITAIPGSYTTGQAGYIVGNNLAAVSTISVAPNRTFRVRAGLSALLCDQVITLQPGEDVTLAVDFSDVLNPGTALATVSTPTETTGASPAPTLDAEALSQDRQKAHFDMTGITDDLSYTVEVSVTTSDGQTLIVDCGLEGEETPT